MASKTLLVILGLALIAVVVSSFEFVDMVEEAELEQDLTEDLTVEDFEAYFTAMQMEKRGSKVGSCKKPDGKPCALCNLKIRNKNDMRRYIACSSAGKGRKI